MNQGAPRVSKLSRQVGDVLRPARHRVQAGEDLRGVPLPGLIEEANEEIPVVEDPTSTPNRGSPFGTKRFRLREAWMGRSQIRKFSVIVSGSPCWRRMASLVRRRGSSRSRWSRIRRTTRGTSSRSSSCTRPRRRGRGRSRSSDTSCRSAIRRCR
ncbi:MAG: hypothetical protein MZV64_29805 [Ignavibacteriales bacterium]|nr:hypothetical protein [Ignavibacteriales bacterium]